MLENGFQSLWQTMHLWHHNFFEHFCLYAIVPYPLNQCDNFLINSFKKKTQNFPCIFSFLYFTCWSTRRPLWIQFTLWGINIEVILQVGIWMSRTGPLTHNSRVCFGTHTSGSQSSVFRVTEALTAGVLARRPWWAALWPLKPADQPYSVWNTASIRADCSHM